MKRNKAFTLIEMIVVVAVLGLVLPIVTTILITILRQQLYIARFAEVKRQGDLIANAIRAKIGTQPIQMYSSTHPHGQVCGMLQATPVDFVSISSISLTTYTGFRVNAGIVQTVSGDAADLATPTSTEDLSTNKVSVSALSTQCIRSHAITSPLVQVKFTIQSAGTASALEQIPSLTYSTMIIVKE